jgi:putative transposase
MDGMFKGYCFPKEIILQALYFKLRFSLSYRDIEELLSIRGIRVDHAAVQRWVYKFTHLIETTFRKRKKAAGNSLIKQYYPGIRGLVVRDFTQCPVS